MLSNQHPDPDFDAYVQRELKDYDRIEKEQYARVREKCEAFIKDLSFQDLRETSPILPTLDRDERAGYVLGLMVGSGHLTEWESKIEFISVIRDVLGIEHGEMKLEIE